jgi:hypothetical protein
LKGVLVRTGKFRESDLGGAIIPDSVLDSIADLPKRWKDYRGRSWARLRAAPP